MEIRRAIYSFHRTRAVGLAAVGRNVEALIEQQKITNQEVQNLLPTSLPLKTYLHHIKDTESFETQKFQWPLLHALKSKVVAASSEKKENLFYASTNLKKLSKRINGHHKSLQQIHRR